MNMTDKQIDIVNRALMGEYASWSRIGWRKTDETVAEQARIKDAHEAFKAFVAATKQEQV